MLWIGTPPAPMMRPMNRTSLPYGLSGWLAATVGKAAKGNDGELLRAASLFAVWISKRPSTPFASVCVSSRYAARRSSSGTIE